MVRRLALRASAILTCGFAMPLAQFYKKTKCLRSRSDGPIFPPCQRRAQSSAPSVAPYLKEGYLHAR